MYITVTVGVNGTYGPYNTVLVYSQRLTVLNLLLHCYRERVQYKSHNTT